MKSILTKFKIKNKLAVVFIGSLLTGCLSNSYQPNLTVTYKSEPAAATLFEGDRNFGYTPVTVTYQLTPAEIKQGRKIINGVNVRWPSGAAACLEQRNVDLSKGYNQELTLVRPYDADGMREDIQFALEIQKLALEAEKSRIQQEQFNRQSLTNFYRQIQLQEQARQQQWELQHAQRNEQIRQQNEQIRRQYPIRCVTNNLGGMLVTNCQ